MSFAESPLVSKSRITQMVPVGRNTLRWSGLDVQSDIHGSFLHSLRNPQLLQAKRDHWIPKDLISPRSVRGFESLVGRKIHLVSRHDGNNVKRMITSRTYSEFSLSHNASLENCHRIIKGLFLFISLVPARSESEAVGVCVLIFRIFVGLATWST